MKSVDMFCHFSHSSASCSCYAPLARLYVSHKKSNRRSRLFFIIAYLAAKVYLNLFLLSRCGLAPLFLFLIFPLIVFGISSVNSMIRTHLYSASRALQNSLICCFSASLASYPPPGVMINFNRLSPRRHPLRRSRCIQAQRDVPSGYFRPHRVRPESRLF